MIDTADIESNIAKVRENIKHALVRSGRDGENVELIAVTKKFPASTIEKAIQCGLTNIGKNRVQEAKQKYSEIGKVVKWHMVGHLQRNKVRDALKIFDFIHSLDSIRLAEEISKQAAKNNIVVPALVQIDISKEETKSGVPIEQAAEFIDQVRELEDISIQGIMTIAPFTDDTKVIRNVFRKLRSLSVEIESRKLPGVQMKYLSMGMTNDYEIAIEEGSNMIRVGTAIFGPRE